MIAASSLQAYAAARSAAGLISRSNVGRIVVSGRDRASFLHSLLTNDIASLAAGHGCYAAYLTPQGRMITDVWVDELGDLILLSVVKDVAQTFLGRLDQFIFSEDVQLGDVSERFPSAAIVGPHAAAVAARLLDVGVDVLTQLPPRGNLRATFAGLPAIVLRTMELGEPGYDVLVDSSVLVLFHERARAEGAVDLDPGTAEILRIEGGIPLFHRDMDEETIPLEAGLESQAISLTKGCYVGQEVIIRILHRGHGRVARKLVGLAMEQGESPSPGAEVSADGRAVGQVTSSTWSPALHRAIALAYVQRDFVEPGARVEIAGGPAVVVTLPFVPLRQ